LFLFGCVSYQVKVIKDDFDGHTIYEMEGNALENMTLSYNQLQLNLQKFVKDGNEEFSLIAMYFSPDWIFIEEGESLKLIVDGEKITLSSKKGSQGHREVFSGTIREMAWYDIDIETIRKLAFGKEGKVKIIGDKYFDEYIIGKNNFVIFNKFYTEHIVKSGKK